MLLSNHEVYSIAGDLHEIYDSDVEEPTIEFTGKLTSLKSSEDLDLCAIYHCDGLMLCQTKDRIALALWFGTHALVKGRASNQELVTVFMTNLL